MDQSLVREIILEHARSAKNGVLPDRPTHGALHANPTCGDSVEVRLRLSAGTIDEMGYRVRGCAVCSASASLMAEALTGLSPGRALEAIEAFEAYVTNGRSRLPEAISSLEVFEHLATNPTRRRCALLPWTALSMALAEATGIDSNDR